MLANDPSNDKKERSPQEIAVNNHLKTQSAIIELQQKITNFSKFVAEAAKDPEVRRAFSVPADLENMTSLVEELNKTAQEWPYDVVMLISMLGPVFYDPKAQQFKKDLFLQLFPQMRNQLKGMPGSDYLEHLKIELLPEKIRDRAFLYLECFCALLCPKDE